MIDNSKQPVLMSTSGINILIPSRPAGVIDAVNDSELDISVHVDR